MTLENPDALLRSDRALAFRPWVRALNRQANRTAVRGRARSDLASSQTRPPSCPSLPSHPAPASRHRELWRRCGISTFPSACLGLRPNSETRAIPHCRSFLAQLRTSTQRHLYVVTRRASGERKMHSTEQQILAFSICQLNSRRVHDAIDSVDQPLGSDYRRCGAQDRRLRESSSTMAGWLASWPR